MTIRYLDFSELESRLDELRGTQETLKCNIDDAIDAAAAADVDAYNAVLIDAVTAAETALEDWEDMANSEYADLLAMDNIIGEFSGSQGVHEHDFEEYAQEVHEDLHGRDSGQEWPYTCIDWKQAARDLMQDYTPVEYEGDTYYVR